MKVETQTTVRHQAQFSHANLREAFALCVAKTRANIRRLADLPQAAPWATEGDYFTHPEGFFEIGNWTSSFFTGMALIAWRKTKEDYFLQQLLRLAPEYRDKALKPECHSHHDMGFLYSLYSVALYKMTGDPAHRAIGIAAAEALYRRFNAKGGFIRAWGRMGSSEFEDMAIIDCMMNLPLFYWAAKETGDKKFYDAAVRQADNTLNYFIRPDDSVYHAYHFDLETGQPTRGDNYCGRAVESHWARGTGWAIYGFALSYRHTGERRYLEASLRIARKFNLELNGDAIPVWDFRLPDGEPALRDTSAAAIVVCGYQELEKLGMVDAVIRNTKRSLLEQICTKEYLNFDDSCPGVLRAGQVGSTGPGTARNAYMIWGDYYLMEALDRELHQAETWW